jgi:hypothetical protein
MHRKQYTLLSSILALSYAEAVSSKDISHSSEGASLLVAEKEGEIEKNILHLPKANTVLIIEKAPPPTSVLVQDPEPEVNPVLYFEPEYTPAATLFVEKDGEELQSSSKQSNKDDFTRLLAEPEEDSTARLCSEDEKETPKICEESAE